MRGELTLPIHFATYSTATYGPKDTYSEFTDAFCHSARQADGCCICLCLNRAPTKVFFC